MTPLQSQPLQRPRPTSALVGQRVTLTLPGDTAAILCEVTKATPKTITVRPVARRGA